MGLKLSDQQFRLLLARIGRGLWKNVASGKNAFTPSNPGFSPLLPVVGAPLMAPPLVTAFVTGVPAKAGCQMSTAVHRSFGGWSRERGCRRRRAEDLLGATRAPPHHIFVAPHHPGADEAYLAHHAKARHFAEDAARHGGTVGGLVEVLVQINKPKFVPSDNQTWRSEGFDACRAARTSLSPHMEWCIASPSHVRVLRIKKVELPAAAAAASGSESAEPATSASSCAP